ncbi:class I SAM-dependent methyltransferase [Polynucleobacter sp. Adler-ghost]|uniref:class I SAM-dependent methyltransferase n=1 Tax=Polynucleobacter sp. Adler-ghost TaxID=2770234 RepID=UPI001BFD6EF2|nr:class I SAM-dependent methyltransferase [Polynucleobacter sp. Adler-ghost]QWE31039.1 class I SAM-dependent methyltransferase [Polynucleobacter sp. Adler-ghost]
MNAPITRFDTEVDCIKNGAPFAKEADSFLNFIQSLPTTPDSFFQRTIIAWELFQRTDEMLCRSDFECVDFSNLLSDITLRAKQFNDSISYFKSQLEFQPHSNKLLDFKVETQNHYGSLFSKFDENHYYIESLELLKTRLERNQVNLGKIGDKIALDAGCGGGRYTYALSALGFKHVTGIDFSELNINTALDRHKRISPKTSFKLGSVHNLPFADNTFDFIFSNGVLHHTESIPLGLKEIHRTLKPHGECFLYLIEKPGGLHWDMTELLRNVMKPLINISHKQFLKCWEPQPTEFFTC